MDIQDLYIKLFRNKKNINQLVLYHELISAIKDIHKFDVLDVRLLRIMFNEIYKINENSATAAKVLELLGDLYSSNIGDKYLNYLFDKNKKKYLEKNITSSLDLKKEMISNTYYMSIKIGDDDSIVKYIDFILNSKDLSLFKKHQTNIERVINDLTPDQIEIYKLRIYDLSKGIMSCYTTLCTENVEYSNGNINELLFDLESSSIDDDESDLQFDIEQKVLKNFQYYTKIEKEKYRSKLKDVEESFPYSAYDDFFFQNVVDKKYNTEIHNMLNRITKIENNPYFKHFILENSDIVDFYFGEEYFKLENFTIYSWTSSLYNDLVYEKNRYLDNGDSLTEIDINISNKLLNNVKIVYKNGAYENSYIDNLLSSIKESHESTDLKNIIKTISYEQNKILRLPYTTNFIFSGCAGSGKTQVLFHRIKFLIDNNRNIKNELLVISPNKNFITTIKTLCEDLKIAYIKVITLLDFYSELLFQYTSPIKDPRLSWYDLIKSNTSLNYDKVNLADDTLLEQSIVQEYYSDEFLNKINNLKSIRIYPITKKQIEKNIIKNKLDVLKVFLPKEVLNLFPKYRRKLGVIHKCELYALLLCFFKRCNNNHKYARYDKGYASQKIDFFYSLFFIDEIQDYNKNELVLINNIKTTNNERKHFNVFGDIDQNLNSYGLKNWDELKEIGNFQKYTINTNYRNTYEIVEFINKKFNKNMISIGFHGENVVYISYHDIFNVLKDDKDIVVICKKLSKFDELKRKVENLFLDIYSCKGLEFKKVLVVIDDFNDKELYVACSRATLKLLLTSKN